MSGADGSENDDHPVARLRRLAIGTSTTPAEGNESLNEALWRLMTRSQEASEQGLRGRHPRTHRVAIHFQRVGGTPPRRFGVRLCLCSEGAVI